jgi:hypothetical protein
MPSIRRRTTRSASSLISWRSAEPWSARSKIGLEPGSILLTTGASTPRGSRGCTRFTLSRTSCAAASTVRDSSNWITTSEIPSLEVERSSLIPPIVLSDASILSVISLSTSSGAAPGSRVVTTTMGKSTFGNSSTPSLR